MSYESKLRFGFAGTAKVLTRFINDAMAESSYFEEALADLVIVKRSGYFVLANEFDWYKGFGPDHEYSRVYSFGEQCAEKYLQEDDLGEKHELHGTYLRIGEEPEDVQMTWFGSDMSMHFSIGILRIEFISDDPTLHLSEGVRIREGMPELGCYRYPCPESRVVGSRLDLEGGQKAFARQEHLDGSLHAAIAIMNPLSFSLKTELMTF